MLVIAILSMGLEISKIRQYLSIAEFIRAAGPGAH